MNKQYKILVVGASGCGKTTLLRRLKNHYFEPRYLPTIGIGEVMPLKVETSQGSMVLNFWDCAGREELQVLGNGFYIGAHAALIMYDLSIPSTFKQINVADIKKVCGNIPMVLVGNKSDLITQETPIQLNTISVKNNLNIEHVLAKLVDKLNA